MAGARQLVSRRIELASPLEAVELFFKNGWTDGLPVVPPTEDLVAAMLDYVEKDPHEVLGIIPPRSGIATMEKIAINAVMAGCRPEYLPVILAALEAMLEPQFNLNGVQATTHPVAPLLIVNGPIAKELDINGAGNCFGQGWRANATIGRAIRLIMMNIGGGTPQVVDKASLGHPGKYSYCIAENEEASPWEPLHVERGLPAGSSAVTVMPCEGPHVVAHNSIHHKSIAESILITACDSMATLGCMSLHWPQGEMLLVLGPQHAQAIALEGWSKDDVKRYVFENARKPLSKVRQGGLWDIRYWPKWFAPQEDDNAMIPVVLKPDDIVVIVAGGPGDHSAIVPTWVCYSATRKIDV